MKHTLALALLASLMAMWAASADARDLDKGTVTDDGTGNPQPHWPEVIDRRFTPQHEHVFFRLTNSSNFNVTLQAVQVRLAKPADADVTSLFGDYEGCTEAPSIVEASPLRTAIVDAMAPLPGSLFELDVDLPPCSAVLIEASGAMPGLEHVVTFVSHPSVEVVPQGFLEIWDGAANE